MAESTPNKRQYRVAVPGKAGVATIDVADFAPIQDKFFEDNPNAQVYELVDFDPQREYTKGDTLSISIPSRGGTATIDGAEFAGIKDKLLADNPDATINQVINVRDNYFKHKAQAAHDALMQFNDDPQRGGFKNEYEASQRADEEYNAAHAEDFTLSPETQYLASGKDRYKAVADEHRKLSLDYYDNPIVKEQMEADAKAADTRAEEYSKIQKGISWTKWGDKLDYSRAIKLERDLAELLRSPGVNDDNGFAQYMHNYIKGGMRGFNDRDAWTAGISAIARNVDIRSIQKKLVEASEGDKLDMNKIDSVLDPSEKALLTSFLRLTQAQYEKAGNMSSAYNAGLSAAQSTVFMAEFMLAGAAGNKLGGAAQKSTSAFARWLGRQIMAEGTLAAEEAFAQAGVSATEQAVTKYITRPAISALWHTALQPSTYRTVSDNMVQIDDAGQLNSAGAAWRDGVLDSIIENWSEGMGAGIEDLMGLGARAVGGLGNLTLGKTSFGQMARYIANTSGARVLKEAGFNGFVGEMAEEWLGNAARVGVGLMSKEEFKDWTSIKSQLEMAASFAPMSLIGLGQHSYAAVKYHKKYNEAVNNLKGVLERAAMAEDPNLSPQELREKVDAVFNQRYATPEDVAEALVPWVAPIAKNAGSDAGFEGYLELLRFAQLTGIENLNNAIEQEYKSTLRDAAAAQIRQNIGVAEDEFITLHPDLLADVVDAETGEQIGETTPSVRYIDFKDTGRRAYIRAAASLPNGDMTYLLVGDSGHGTYIKKSELDAMIEAGQAVDSGYVAYDEHLDAEAKRFQDERLAQAIAAQEQETMNAVQAQANVGDQINVGSEESPVMAVVTSKSNDGVVLQFPDGTYQSKSWNELRNMMNIPQTPVMSQEEMDNQRADAELQIEKTMRNLNDNFGYATFQGPDGVTYVFHRAVEANGDGTIRAYVSRAGERNSDMAMDLTPDMVSAITASGAMELGGTFLDEEQQAPTGEAAAIADEQAAEAEMDQPDVPVDFRGNPLPMKDNGKVDQQALWNKDPEAWAKWNDGQENPAISSKQYIENQLKVLQKQYNDLEKKRTSATSLEDAEAIQEQQAAMTPRMQQLQSLYDGYVAAEIAQQQAAEAEAKRQEELRKAEEKARKEEQKRKEAEAKRQEQIRNSTPVDARGVVAKMLSSLMKDHALNYASFRQALGWSAADMRQFGFIWSKKGLTPDGVAHYIAEHAQPDEFALLPKYNGNAEQADETIIKDIVLDMLNSYSRKQISSYVTDTNKEFYQAIEEDMAAMAEAAEQNPEVVEQAFSEEETAYDAAAATFAADEVSPEDQEFLDAMDALPAAPTEQKKTDRDALAQQIVDTVEQWSKTLGFPIRLCRDIREVKNKDARAAIIAGEAPRGWYNKSTGEIELYLPQLMENTKWVVPTIIHEAVSHHGLKQLLGEENFNTLLDNVFGLMSESDRSAWLEYVNGVVSQEEYSAARKNQNPGLSDEQIAKGYAEYVLGQQRAAADEYIAHIADQFDAEQHRSIWQRIVDAVREFLAQRGLINSIDYKVMESLLAQSLQNLKKNGYVAPGNQQRNGETMMSKSTGSRTLVGIHNISADKIRKALNLGGLVNPSAAVVDLAIQNHFGYGEISLVMPSSLVDSKSGRNAGTFDRDAWTPIYPRVEYFRTKESDENLKDLLAPVADRKFADMLSSQVGSYLAGNAYNSGLEYLFLLQQDQAPEIAVTPRRYGDTLNHVQSLFAGQPLEYENYLNLPEDVKRQVNVALLTLSTRSYDEYVGGRQSRKDLVDADLGYSTFESATWSLIKDNQNAGVPNYDATIENAVHAINAAGMRDVFSAWQAAAIDALGFDKRFQTGWRADGTRIYKKATLENISRYMKTQGRNASKDHYSIGPGMLLAQAAKRMTTLESIRKNRGQLIPFGVNVEDAHRELQNRLLNACHIFHPEGMPLSEYDQAWGFLEDVLLRGMSPERAVEEFKDYYKRREYGSKIQLDEEDKAELLALREDIKKAPTYYFETKFERPVSIDEFAAAVIPNNLDSDVRTALESAGLPVHEYDPNVDGSRREATLAAAETDGVLFSKVRVTPETQQEMDQIVAQALVDGTLHKAPNGADSKLDHQQWALVRTKAFKDWFGDWENDPENASKVLDENGEPLVVFHTSTSDYINGEFQRFNEFRRDYARFGFYFSDSASFSDAWASTPEQQYQCFMNLRNPRIEDAKGRYWDEIGFVIGDVRDTADLMYEAERQGHDGVILRNVEEGGFYTEVLTDYVAFNANQVKSATENNGEYSRENNDIRFSKITPAQDAEYMEAVNAGDMEKAQQMVDAAAEIWAKDSVVRDENGKLKKVYHGTPSQRFNVFDHDHKRKDYDYGTTTFMFSDTQEISESYTERDGHTYEVFLNIKSPKVKDFEGRAWNGMSDHTGRYQIVPMYDQTYNSREEAEEALQKILDEYYPNDPAKQEEQSQYMYVFELMDTPKEGETTNDLSREISESDQYDGGIAKNVIDYADVSDDKELMKILRTPHTDYFVKDANQIKSTEPVTYDDEGNVIPLSRRFNSESNDIRFSKAYHGTSANFLKFDNDHVGQGEGHQAHGYGTYVTFEEARGRKYADKIATYHTVQEDKLLHNGQPVIYRNLKDELNDWDNNLKDVPFENIVLHGFLLARSSDPKQVDRALRSLYSDMEIDDHRGAQRIYDALMDYRKDPEAYQMKGDRHLYDVEIPEDDGTNYIDEEKPVQDEIIQATNDALLEHPVAMAKLNTHNEEAGKVEKTDFMGELKDRNGKKFYNQLAALVGEPGYRDDKEASRILSEIGVVGIKYDGQLDGPCAVIFDAENIEITGHTMFSKANNNQRIFVSNAAQAVEALQLNKASGDAWIKAIQGRGGLKAGEDKWLGLSDWLKSQDGPVTKQAVLDFISQNQIQIEEVMYSENGQMSEADIDDFYDELPPAVEEFNDRINEEFRELLDQGMEWQDAYNAMAETYGAPFEEAYDISEQSEGDDYLQWIYPDSLMRLAGFKNDGAVNNLPAINSTRLTFTTEGLENKREIALTVPTIEPYKENDAIHFGDAGNGRAVAWVRFGETIAPNEEGTSARDAWRVAARRYMEYSRDLENKYDVESSAVKSVATPEELAKLDALLADSQEAAETRRNVKDPRVLVVDEIQSKRHQDGREKGYLPNAKDYERAQQLTKDFFRIAMDYSNYANELAAKYGVDRPAEGDWDAWGKIISADEMAELKSRFDKTTEAGEAKSMLEQQNAGRVPDAPFDKNWHELAFKRILRLAAEEGFDKLAWTTGEQQAERYDLSAYVSDVELRQDEDGIRSYAMYGGGEVADLQVDHDGKIVSSGYSVAPGTQLSELVGKELAARMSQLTITDDKETSSLEVDASIGGEGMKGFYDEIIPRFVDKYCKKWGVKTRDVKLPNIGKTMHSIDITPEMRTSVMAGQTMFSKSKLTDVDLPAAERLVNLGFAVSSDEVRFSHPYSIKPGDAGKVAADIAAALGVSKAKARRWVDAELSLTSLVLSPDNVGYLVYEADERYEAIKKNSDYPQGSVDFNNICVKRRDVTEIYQRLQKMYPNKIITGEDLANIRQIMKDHHRVVTCGLCYVEDRRQLLGEIASEFITALRDGFKRFGAINKTKHGLADKMRKQLGQDDKVDLSIYDLLTIEGSTRLFYEHRGIYDAFQTFNNARGQQAGNLFQGYAEYKREIMKWNQKKVDKVNSLGGLRIFSYSDFEAHHLLDIAQIILDCARKGVKIQGYTKVPEFARLVANTGMKINRSLIPAGDTGMKMVDGKPTLAYDFVEGIDIHDENFLESNDNIGNILIGINAEQIRLAMADPFVHFIIPYHSNQKLELRIMKKTGAWTNYKYEQREKNLSDGKAAEKGVNIYTDVLNAAEAEGHPIKTEREFTERFLDVCKKRGLIPRFSEFLEKNEAGDYVYTPGYYKMLVDFKMFDEQGNILPQKPVVPELDVDLCKQILDRYVEGEKARHAEELDEVFDAVVNAVKLDERPDDVHPLVEASNTRMSKRTKPAPKNIEKVYKLMRLGADGQLYPLFIGSKEAIALKQWYDADSPKMENIAGLDYGWHLMDLSTGKVVESRPYETYEDKKGATKVKVAVTKAEVEAASADNKRWIRIIPDQNLKGTGKTYHNVGLNGSVNPKTGKEDQGLSYFALRPGWHATNIPAANQIGGEFRQDEYVWVEGYIAADVNYQDEADKRNSKAAIKAGRHDGDIVDHIPEDGYDYFQTNSNANPDQLWYISGSFMADRILSDNEARRIVDEKSKELGKQFEYDKARRGGRMFNAETMQLEEPETLFSKVTPGVQQEMARDAIRVINGIESTRINQSLSATEAISFVSALEVLADDAPAQVEFNEENYARLFANGIETPEGLVKMGDGQYQKFMDLNRDRQLALAEETLRNPDFITHKHSEAKEGARAERDYSKVYGKVFSIKSLDGDSKIHYNSVSVLIDGTEVVVSNYKPGSVERFRRELKEGSLTYIRKVTLPSESGSSAQGDQRTIDAGSSLGKGTQSFENSKTKEQKRETMFSKVNVTPAVQQEMDQIVAQALLDGTLHKAPNGADSKLNHQQWALVRTKAFKKWFGDWENDPENASKVIDKETGEPLVMMHGTRAEYDFQEFNTNIDEVTNNMGAHFGSADAAEWFAYDSVQPRDDSKGRIYDVFLNIRNPFDTFDWFGQDDAYPATEATFAAAKLGTPEAREEFERIKALPGLEWLSFEDPESNLNNDGLRDDFYLKNEEDRKTLYRSIRKIIEMAGYDGISYFNDLEDAGDTDYIVFQPNQVKSAVNNTGEYDQEQADIRFSKANAAQKQAGGNYLTDLDLDSVTRFSLSKANKATVGKWLDKYVDTYFKVPEGASEEVKQQQAQNGAMWKEMTIAELEKMTNPTMQLCAARWFCKGTVRLGGEDDAKMAQAIEVARKHKVDPMSFDSPMAIINQWPESVKEKPINPDDVSTLHKVIELPNGITIYDVDDTQASRVAMRQIINTHFGKDCSPWCLLQGDGQGNLSSESRRYWRHYNAYPKQVAFYKGKLLAFSANDSEERVWWDRQDKSYPGIPVVGKIPDDELGRSATLVYAEDTGIIRGLYNVHKGNKENGLYQEWTEGNYGLVLRESATYKDGLLDGPFESYWQNGQVGLRTSYKAGELMGRYEVFNRHGVKIKDYNYKANKRDGLYVEYYENGRLLERAEYKDGSMNGLLESWFENGQMSERFHYTDGKLDGLVEKWFEDGSIRERSTYKLVNGASIKVGVSEHYWQGGLYSRSEYGNDGNRLWYERYDQSDGRVRERQEYKDGREITTEYFNNGEVSNITHRDKVGRIIYLEEYRPDGTLGFTETRKDGYVSEQRMYDTDGTLQSITRWENNKIVEHIDASKNPQTLFSLAGVRSLDNLSENERRHRLETLGQALIMKADSKKLSKDRLDVIWAATGWTWGKDGKARYELPDLELADMRSVTEGQNARNMKLGDLVESCDLFDYYPQLREINVVIKPMTGGDLGAYVQGENKIDLAESLFDKTALAYAPTKNVRDVLVHELQHAVQRIEGFDTGSNNRAIRRQLEQVEQIENILADAAKLRKENKPMESQQLLFKLANDISGKFGYPMDALNTAMEDATTLDKLAYALYKAVSGEVEARNVTRRAKEDEEYRSEVAPISSEDTAREDQIRNPQGFAETENNTYNRISSSAQALGVDRPIVSSEYAKNGYRNVNGAIMTVVHKVQRRKGLGAVIGQSAAQAFFMEQFASAPEQVRRKIIARVMNNGYRFNETINKYIVDVIKAKQQGVIPADRQEFLDNALNALNSAMAANGVLAKADADDFAVMMHDAMTEGKDDLITLADRAEFESHTRFSRRFRSSQKKVLKELNATLAEEQFLGSAAKAYNRGAANVMNRIRESWVDQFDAVQRLVDAIVEVSGKPAKPFEDVMKALNQQSSKGLALFTKWVQEYGDPFMRALETCMKKADCNMDDMKRYMFLKHGLERNEKMAAAAATDYYQSAYDARVKDIEADTTMSEDKKAQEKEKAQKALDKHLAAIAAGTDELYQQNREKDYGGITAMFSTFDDYDDFDPENENVEEFNARVIKARHPMYDTLAEAENAARAEIDEWETKFDGEQKGMWRRLKQATQQTLKYEWESGLITRDQYDEVRGMYEYYVPMRGFQDAEAEDLYSYYHKAEPVSYENPLMKARGRKTEAESPFGHIYTAAQSAIASSVKNESKLALYYLVSNRPNDVINVSELWYEDSGQVDASGKRIFVPVYPEFDKSLSSGAAKNAYQIWQDEMEQKAANGQAFKGAQGLDMHNSVINVGKRQADQHIINFRVNGKDMMMFVNGNPRAAQAINGDFNVETSNDYQKFFSKILRLFAGLNTEYNPEFWLSNFQRDMLMTLMSVSAKEDKAYQREFRKNYKDALKVLRMHKEFEAGTLGHGMLETYYREFVENGGVTGYTVINANEEWEQELRKKVGDEKMNLLEKARQLPVVEAFAQLGEAIEQTNRFAVYLTSRQMGKSTVDAIADAKEVTVNFNRKGSGQAISWEEADRLRDSKGRPLSKAKKVAAVLASGVPVYGRRFVMFFNAAVQGLNTMYNLYKANPKKMAAWTGAYFAAGLLNAMLHAAMDDDDDYLDIPDYERRNNLLFGYKGAYLKWALPQETRVFYALGDMAVQHALGRTPDKSIFMEALDAAMDVAPVNPTGGVTAVLPSVATPIIEVWMNKDYRGQRVYDDQKWMSDGEKDRTPKYKSALRSTGRAYTNVSKLLNFISGGDETDAGFIDINPAVVQHLVEGYTGGAGTTVMKFANALGGILRKGVELATPGEFEGSDAEAVMDWLGTNDLTVSQTPFLRRVMTVTSDRTRNAHVSDLYYYYKAEAEHTAKRLKQYEESENYDKYDKLVESEDYEIMQIYESYKDTLKQYDRLVRDSETKSEREQYIAEQEQLRKDMIREISEIGKNK